MTDFRSPAASRLLRFVTRTESAFDLPLDARSSLDANTAAILAKDAVRRGMEEALDDLLRDPSNYSTHAWFMTLGRSGRLGRFRPL